MLSVCGAAIEGYLDMMPRSVDPTAQSLASRLEVVRSYVQDSENSGDENSDESSIGSLCGSDEHLPKVRNWKKQR